MTTINHEDLFGERMDPKLEKNKKIRHEHLRRYKLASKKVGDIVLDFGCGTGYGSSMLHDRARKIIGIDISQTALKYAQKNYPGPKYMRILPGKRIPFPDDYFDSIVAFEVVEHVIDVEKLLKELSRVLRKGGVIYISTPNTAHLTNFIKKKLLHKPYPIKNDECHVYHIKEFTYDEFIQLIQKYFNITNIWGNGIAGLPPLLSQILEKLVKRLCWDIIIEARKN